MAWNHAENMELVTETNAQRSTVRVRGEVDVSNAPRLVHDLVSVSYHAPHGIVVDLTETTFLDCRGAAALLGARHIQHSLGRPFELRGARRSVRKVLECAGLTDPERGAPTASPAPVRMLTPA